MSTLNEIAANHARMTNAVAAGTTEPSERQPLLVVGFQAPAALDGHAPVPLHLMLAAQEPSHLTCLS
ncbi:MULTISPECIES: hypothetical protein [Pseudomonas]|uniref:Uncharacterized protein n=1 Tax=Pseudomonas fluorescens TaxID=294 RepID=A0A5E6PHL9_PSEFL|nr:MULTISPECIES: hypothetical protein [Pseudomonas]VVM42984.1 hypothetical protein PS652_00365 [Pseudomonas fluorescens]